METDNIIEIKSDDNWYITYRDIADVYITHLLPITVNYERYSMEYPHLDGIPLQKA